MEERRAQGEVLYPHKFHVSISLENFLEKYKELKEEQESSEVVTIVGRIHAIRESSAKLRFYDLRGEDVKVQVSHNL